MKRKPEDAPDPSGSKMPRRDGDNSLNESGEVRPWEQRPGMILEVKMRNFMCHQVCLNDREICQATGTGTGNGTGNRESRIETVPVLTVKSHGPPPTHHPPHNF